jgi:hypothetical protein
VPQVVHIYEPYLSGCHSLNKYLEQLARKYASMKFLRLQGSKTRQELDEVAMPILVVYQVRGGVDEAGEGGRLDDLAQ